MCHAPVGVRVPTLRGVVAAAEVESSVINLIVGQNRVKGHLQVVPAPFYNFSIETLPPLTLGHGVVKARRA